LTTALNSRMREWMDLDKEQKEINARVRDIKKEKERLQEVILEDFAESGISKIDIDGRLLYAHHELYVGAKKVIHPGTGEEVIPWVAVSQILKECGFDEYVQEKFDSIGLAKALREMHKDPDSDIPELILEHFNIFEKRSLRSKAGKKVKG